MGRIRTLKPEFFRSRSLSKVTRDARLTFAGLWCEADDAGRGEADPRLLKGTIWPLDDDITPGVIEDHLAQLVATNHVQLYTVDGDRFYVIVKFEKHQAAAYRRGEAKHPGPTDADPVDNPPKPPVTRAHADACKEVHDAPGIVLEGNGREGKGTPPTSQVTQPGAGDSRIVDIIQHYGQLALADAKAKGTRIGNDDKYTAAARDRITRNPDLHRWADMFPDAPATAVAAWLTGDKHSMAYHQRADDQLATIHPINGGPAA